MATVSFAAWKAASGWGEQDGRLQKAESISKQLLSTVGQAVELGAQLKRAAMAHLVAALVMHGQLPPKLNMVIQPLMNVIRAGSKDLRQLRLVSDALGELLAALASRSPSPNDKILANLVKVASSQGAQEAIASFASKFGAELFTTLPKLWAEVSAVRSNACSAALMITPLLSTIHPTLQHQIAELLEQLFASLGQPEPQPAVVQCIGAAAKHITSVAMARVVRSLVPMLQATSSTELTRIGVVHAISAIVEQLQLGVCPYGVFLVIPLMGAMTDRSAEVRQLSSSSFAKILQLLPLDKETNLPDDFPSELAKHKAAESKLIKQLLDPSSAEDYVIPLKINASLRPYQQAGVNWLRFLYKANLHGILCDDMGLGKSLQSICIVAATCVELRGTDTAAPSLVVAPPTLVSHWLTEFQKFCGDQITVAAHAGSRRGKLLPSADVVVTSYEGLRADVELYEKTAWSWMVLDEGHVIRNSNAKITQAVKRVQAKHRLVLSGTPIQNSVSELWSVFDFLMPGFLDTKKHFNEHFVKPLTASRKPKATSSELAAGEAALSRLHRQVLPFLLRRMKTDVLDDLPPKTIQDYVIELSEVQRQLYTHFSESALSEVPGGGNSRHIFQALQYLRKLCNHPALVLTPEHPLHGEITQSLEKAGTPLHSTLAHAPKLMALKQLLVDSATGVGEKEQEDKCQDRSIANNRMLVFSQQKSMLDLIESQLLKPEMPEVHYLRLDGSVEAGKRGDIVRRFNEDPTIDVLLLTTHVGGLGLNLTGANTVVFMDHDWNPQKDLQAMDRAHRIGQTRTVNVYRLITANTLEQKIMSLQQFKLHVANTVVDQQNSSMLSMGTEHLLDLMTYSDHGEVSLQASGHQAQATKSKSKRSTGMKAVLEDLDGLWDEQEYNEEYDLSNYISSCAQAMK